MINSIFYKEWIKTRRVLFLAIIVFACFIIYTFINVGQIFRVSGAVAVWTDTMLKDISLLPKMEWLPLIFSILFGASQFVPEMVNKRLKLTLHLPLPENKIMYAMLFYGIICLLLLYAAIYAVLIIGMGMYYPAEIVLSMFKLSLPWFLAGLIGYLFVAWICLEPVWRQRIFNSLIAICAINFFMIAAKSGAYVTFIPYLVVLIIVAYTFPFYSMSRFKEGAQ